MKDLTLPTPALPPTDVVLRHALAALEIGRYYAAAQARQFIREASINASVKDDKDVAKIDAAMERVRAVLSNHEDGRAETRGVVVPMEATEAMLAAVRKRPHPTRPDGWDAHHAALWRAMVAAHQTAEVAP